MHSVKLAFYFYSRFYRLKTKRPLGNIFTNDLSSGCTKDDPGIGDVTFVKDILTESILTTNFKCSIFGPHTHPSLGWVNILFIFSQFPRSLPVCN